MTPLVLIVDDNEDNRCVLSDALESEGYALREAADGVEALAQVEREPPDLILLDVMMPNMDGIECCRRLADDPATRHIPVLLVTALDTDHQVVAGLDAGACDYLAKPFAGPVVRARVRAALRAKFMHDELLERKAEIERLAAELEARNEELGALAHHDGLTGLPNRLLFMDRLDRALARARRHREQKIAILYLDFDRFKHVNDTLGHAAGDELLQSIAERLRSGLRSVDSTFCRSTTPSRMGGDEFVILLEELCDAADVEMIADRLKTALAAPHVVAGRELVCTASIGIVTGDAESDAGALLRDADAAMYHAKQIGPSRHAVFDASMAQGPDRHDALEAELREAIEQGHLTVHYQPIVDLESGTLESAEALVRWRHPDRGLLAFEEFADVAHASGLLPNVGQFVVREACRTMHRWRERFGASAPARVTVNISERQLEEPAAADDVRGALADAALEPNALMLEVPEHVFTSGSVAVRRSIEQLRELGVNLAMDNWGAGPSGLAILRDLPIDLLKIDRAVVGELDGRTDRSAVVHAVIALAHNLRIKVAAVGIEDSGQLAQLQALECDFGQGWYLGRPGPADRFGRDSQAARTATRSCRAPRYAEETR